jgi:hypothetical protein
MAIEPLIKQSKFMFSWQPAGTAGVSQGRHWDPTAEDGDGDGQMEAYQYCAP